jgi:hypothetical protein
MRKILLILILTVALASVSSAENVDSVQGEKRNTVHATFAFDPGFGIGAGYARELQIRAIDRVVLLSVDLSAPMFLLDLQNYKLGIGTQISLFESDWNVINEFRVLNKGISNAVYHGNLTSIEEGLLAGYFSDKWFVAIEAHFEKFLFAYMSHTEYYKGIYSDVKDGWYGSTGGKWRFALQGGYTISDRVEPILRVGTYLHERFSLPVFSMPVFGEVIVKVHF